MINWNKYKIIFPIVILFISSLFILSYPYPLNESTINNGPSPVWRGGTIPDEFAYFGWSQIYFETGKTYVFLEDVGPDKIQHIDFYIGNSPDECIFVKVDVSKNDGLSNKWMIKERDIIVTLYDGNNNGINGLSVEVIETKTNKQWNGQTNQDGTYILSNIPPGSYQVLIDTPTKHLKTFFSTDYHNINYPIEVTAFLKSYTPTTVEVLIHVDHYINKNLKDVKIYRGFNPNKKPDAVTDESGDSILIINGKQEMYHVIAVKETLGIIPPVGSGIVEIQDSYAFANHWPPGYCYFIIPFWVTGTILFIPFLLSFISSISTFYLAKKLFDIHTAIIASILVLISGLGMVTLFSRGLADYAAMAFATLGITIFIYSINQNKKQSSWFIPILLGLFGGLCFAYAVTMRYSTIILLIGPISYTIISIWKKTSENKDKTFLVSWIKQLIYYLKKSIPFIIGLILIGGMLAAYNTQLFGGPLNSGYQTDIHIETEGENTTIEQPDKTMFQQYFNPSIDSVNNLFNRILPQLLFLLPTLFIAPIGMILDRKRKRMWMLFFWILPILIIYMQLSWVGKVPIEDMRYFLPLLPPTAILTAYVIKHFMKKSKNHTFFISLITSLFLLIGFIMAGYGMNWQLHRRELGPIFQPPVLAILLIISLILLVYTNAIYLKIIEKKKSNRAV